MMKGSKYTMRAKTLNPCNFYFKLAIIFKILIQLNSKFLVLDNINLFQEPILKENNSGLNIKVPVVEKYHLQRSHVSKLHKERMYQDQVSILPKVLL